MCMYMLKASRQVSRRVPESLLCVQMALARDMCPGRARCTGNLAAMRNGMVDLRTPLQAHCTVVP